MLARSTAHFAPQGQSFHHSQRSATLPQQGYVRAEDDMSQWNRSGDHLIPRGSSRQLGPASHHAEEGSESFSLTGNVSALPSSAETSWDYDHHLQPSESVMPFEYGTHAPAASNVTTSSGKGSGGGLHSYAAASESQYSRPLASSMGSYQPSGSSNRYYEATGNIRPASSAGIASSSSAGSGSFVQQQIGGIHQAAGTTYPGMSSTAAANPTGGSTALGTTYMEHHPLSSAYNLQERDMQHQHLSQPHYGFHPTSSQHHHQHNLPSLHHHQQQHHHHQQPQHHGYQSSSPLLHDFSDFRSHHLNPFEVKHRRRTTRSQFKILESTFLENPKPNAAVRKSISQQLDMPLRSVQIWFQNRRAKAKAMAKRDSHQTSGGGGSESSSQMTKGTTSAATGAASSESSGAGAPASSVSYSYDDDDKRISSSSTSSSLRSGSGGADFGFGFSTSTSGSSDTFKLPGRPARFDVAEGSSIRRPMSSGVPAATLLGTSNNSFHQSPSLASTILTGGSGSYTSSQQPSLPSSSPSSLSYEESSGHGRALGSGPSSTTSYQDRYRHSSLSSPGLLQHQPTTQQSVVDLNMAPIYGMESKRPSSSSSTSAADPYGSIGGQTPSAVSPSSYSYTQRQSQSASHNIGGQQNNPNSHWRY